MRKLILLAAFLSLLIGLTGALTGNFIVTKNTIGGNGQFNITVIGGPLPNTVNTNVITGFLEPVSVSIDPTGTFGYVANYYNSFGATIGIFRTGTNALVGNVINVPEGPGAVAIAPTGNFAYAAIVDYGINVINTQTNTITNTVVGNILFINPSEIVFNPQPNSPYAYFTSNGNKFVDVINTITNNVINTFNTMYAYPWGVAVSNNGTTLYVTMETAGSGPPSYVEAMNSTTGALQAITKCSFQNCNLYGITTVPNSNFAFIVNASNSIAVYNTINHAIVGQFPATGTFSANGIFGIAANPSGNNLYIANGNEQIDVIPTPNVYTSNIITTSNSGTTSFNSLGVGQYLTEEVSLPPGWIYGESSCTGTNTIGNLIIASQLTTTCNFINGNILTTGTPVSIPTGINYYIGINLFNLQNTGVNANVPLEITINATKYSKYYTCNLNNAELFFANGTNAYSWLEGNLINELSANTLCTSASSRNSLVNSNEILYWFKNPNAGFLSAFANAINYFEKAVSTPDQFLNLVVSGVLSAVEGAAQLLIQAAQTVIDIVFDIVEALARLTRKALNAAWSIPFVSDLYKRVTGGELTAVDLVAMIVAIPGTIFYKLAAGAAPFPTESDVEAFKGQFTGPALLSAMGLTPSDAAVRGAEAFPPPLLLQTMNALNAASLFVYSSMTAYNDASLPASSPNEAFVKANYIAELAVLATGALGQISTQGIDCPGAVSNFLLIVQGASVFIDGLFIKLSKKFPANVNDAGVWVAFGMGAVAGILTFTEAIWVKLPGPVVATNFLTTFPSLCKLLRFKEVIEYSEPPGASLIALGLLDILFYQTGALVIIATLNNSTTPPAIETA